MSPADIKFGTDGWRARLDDGFTRESVILVALATAEAFVRQVEATGLDSARLYVGFDTRKDADYFAGLAAETIQVYAGAKLEVILSDRYVPTPTLCWTVAHDPQAIGGVQLTASHNPAGWLGFKVRMSDGGASPESFTNEIESLMQAEKLEPGQGKYVDIYADPATKDILSPYMDALTRFVNVDLIRAFQPKIVVDPLYGASRVYLADLFESLGAQVVRIHDNEDSNFGGLHPEPIPPWTDAAAALVREMGAQAGFVLDGDADRLGALDEEGSFVSPHQIIALIAQHLIENRGERGRIIKTLSTSVLVDRMGRELGAQVVTTPVGFKWIYGEMLAGDVLVGGEESGGIGIPGHVRERDGLLMSLLLCEMMATTGLSLKQLVARLKDITGELFYQRDDLKIGEAHMARFREVLPSLAPATIAGTTVESYTHTDGAKFLLPNDEWLLLRASGTEPLVRIYAESASPERTKELIAAGNQLVQEAN